MIKSIKQALTKKRHADFHPFVEMELLKDREKLERSQRIITTYTQNIKSTISSIEHYQSHLKTCKNELTTAKKQQIIEEKKMASRVVPIENITKQWERLQRHKMVRTIEIAPDKLTIYTQPIFTDIRLHDFTKDVKRTFVGCFKIVINVYLGNKIKIYNLSFPDCNRAHWSVSSENSACEGDWQPIIEDIRKRGDMMQLASTLLTYLQSTEDGAAYIRSNTWRKYRINSSTDYPPCTEVGQYGIYRQETTDHSNDSLMYLPVLTVERDDGTRGVVFLTDVYCHNDLLGGKQTNNWRAKYYRAQLITDPQELFDHLHTNPTKAQTQDWGWEYSEREHSSSLAPIDNMTQEQAEADYLKLIKIQK